MGRRVVFSKDHDLDPVDNRNGGHFWITAAWARATASQIQHQPLRVLDRFLDAHEEGDRFAAVDDAVVVA
jgi:hypothetical protein